MALDEAGSGLQTYRRLCLEIKLFRVLLDFGSPALSRDGAWGYGIDSYYAAGPLSDCFGA